MFTSPILRSTISLSSQALKTQAPKQIRLSINKSNAKHFATLYLSKIPCILQWGAVVGTILFWPHAAIKLVNFTGGLNPRVRYQSSA